MERLNDLFLNMIVNPQLSLELLLVNGLSSSNTTVNMDKNEYKKKKIIQDAFTGPDGNFDEDTFNKKYNEAILLYNVMSDQSRNDYVLKIINSMPFTENSRLGDPYARKKIQYDQKIRPVHYIELDMFTGETSTYSSQGVYEPGILGDRVKTELEVAEGLKMLTNPVAVANGAKPIWTDAPEGIFSKGHWKDYFTTKVLARYEDNGTHIDMMTGEEKLHFLGELKLNEEGKPYYEYLDGRNVYGKEVLNRFNTLTKEDSWINQYDFFDSDDIKQKSLTGMTMQGLALVGTMFLPYVGPYIALSSMLLLVSLVAAKIAKMATGDVNSPFLNAVEGFLKSLDRQTLKTEYAREHTWSPENILNSITDLTALLRELRAIFDAMPVLLGGSKYVIHGKFNQEALEKGIRASVAEETKAILAGLEKIPVLKMAPIKQIAKQPVGSLTEAEIASLKPTAAITGEAKAINEINNTLKQYYGISGMLSKAYIASLISSNLYEEAIQSGLDPASAAMITLGRFASEMVLLNTPVGNAILPELRVEKLLARRMLDKLLSAGKEERSALYSRIKDSSQKYLLGTDRPAKLLWFRNLVGSAYNIGERSAKIVDKMGNNPNLRETLLSAVASGIEIGTVNDLEEFLNDTWKQIYNFLSSDNSKKFENEMAPWQNMVDRYGMGMVSGLVGGTITSGFSNYSVLHNTTNVTSESAWQLIIHELNNGGPNSDFFKLMFKLKYASDDLSSKRYVIDSKGNTVWQPVQKGEMSLDLEVKMLMQKLITNVHDILESHQLQLSDKELLHYVTHGNYTYENALKDMAYNALANSKSARAILQEYNNICADIVKAEYAIKEAYENVGDQKADRENVEQEIAKYREQLDAALKRKEELFDDKNILLNYITPALYEANPMLHSKESPFDIYYYAQTKGIDYDSLNEEQRIKLKANFDADMKLGGTDLMRVRAQRLLDHINVLHDELKQHAESTSSEVLIKDALRNAIDKAFTGVPEARRNELAEFLYSKDQNTLRSIAMANLMKEPDFALHNAQNNEKNFVDMLLSAFYITRADANKESDWNASIQEVANLYRLKNKLFELINETEITDEARQKFLGLFINGDNIGETLTKDNINFYIETIDREIENIRELQNTSLLNNFARELGYDINGNNEYDDTKNNILKLFQQMEYIPQPLKTSFLNAIDNINTELELEFGDDAIEMIDTMNSIKNIITEKPNSIIEQSVDKYLSKLLKDKSFSVSELINSIDKSLNEVNDISLFAIDSNNMNNIDTAISALEYYINIVEATRSDNKSPQKLFGFTTSLNELALKRHVAQWEPLLEMDSSQADIIVQDAYLLHNRLSYYKQLQSLISGRKLATQNRIMTNYVNKLNILLKTCFDNLSENNDNFKKKKAQLQNVLNELTVIQSLSDKKTIDQSELHNIFGDIQKLNSVIKNVFSDMSSNEIAEFMNFNENFKKIFDANTMVFNDTSESINERNIYYYIAAASSLDFSLFINAVGNFIESQSRQENKNSLITPMFMQLMSDYGMLAFTLNHSQYNKFTKALHDYVANGLMSESSVLRDRFVEYGYLDSSEKIDPANVESVIIRKGLAPYLFNTISQMGSAGSGKSSAMINYVYNILLQSGIDDLNANVLMFHAANALLGELMAATLREGNPNNKTVITKSSLQDFLGTVVYNMKQSDNGRLTQAEFNSGRNYKEVTFINDSATKKPSLIIIDELLALGRDVLLLLDKYCQENNIYILGYGDTLLMGDSYTLTDGKHFYVLSFFETLAPQASPKLGATIRASVNVKSLNLALIEMFLSKMLNEAPELSLKYGYTDDHINNGTVIQNALFGDLIIRLNDLNEFSKLENKIVELLKLFKLRLKEGETIGFIYHSKNTPLYKLLESNNNDQKIKFYNQDEALGSESDFYIIEPFTGNKESNLNEQQRAKRLKLLHTIYTGITRGKKATITLLVGNDSDLSIFYRVGDSAKTIRSTETKNIVFENLGELEKINNMRLMLKSIQLFMQNKTALALQYIPDNIKTNDTLEGAQRTLDGYGKIYYNKDNVLVELKIENGIIYLYNGDTKIEWELFKDPNKRPEGYYTESEKTSIENTILKTISDYDTKTGTKSLIINGLSKKISGVEFTNPNNITILMDDGTSYDYRNIKNIINKQTEIEDVLNKKGSDIAGRSFIDVTTDKRIIILNNNGDGTYDVINDGILDIDRYKFEDISLLEISDNIDINVDSERDGFEFFYKGDDIFVKVRINNEDCYFRYAPTSEYSIQKDVKNIIDKNFTSTKYLLLSLLLYNRKELPDNVLVYTTKEINDKYLKTNAETSENDIDLHLSEAEENIRIQQRDKKDTEQDEIESSEDKRVVQISDDGNIPNPLYNLYTFNIINDSGLESLEQDFDETLFTSGNGLYRIDGVYGIYRILRYLGRKFNAEEIVKTYINVSNFLQNYTVIDTSDPYKDFDAGLRKQLGINANDVNIIFDFAIEKILKNNEVGKDEKFHIFDRENNASRNKISLLIRYKPNESNEIRTIADLTFGVFNNPKTLFNQYANYLKQKGEYVGSVIEQILKPKRDLATDTEYIDYIMNNYKLESWAIDILKLYRYDKNWCKIITRDDSGLFIRNIANAILYSKTSGPVYSYEIGKYDETNPSFNYGDNMFSTKADIISQGLFVSEPMTIIKGDIDGVEKRPFIIVSSIQYNTDQEYLDRYIKERKSNALQKTTEIVYILGKTIKAEDFFDYLDKMLKNGSSDNPVSKFSAYSLFKHFNANELFDKLHKTFIDNIIASIDNSNNKAASLSEKETYTYDVVNGQEEQTRLNWIYRFLARGIDRAIAINETNKFNLYEKSKLDTNIANNVSLNEAKGVVIAKVINNDYQIKGVVRPQIRFIEYTILNPVEILREGKLILEGDNSYYSKLLEPEIRFGLQIQNNEEVINDVELRKITISLAIESNGKYGIKIPPELIILVQSGSLNVNIVYNLNEYYKDLSNSVYYINGQNIELLTLSMLEINKYFNGKDVILKYNDDVITVYLDGKDIGIINISDISYIGGIRTIKFLNNPNYIIQNNNAELNFPNDFNSLIGLESYLQREYDADFMLLNITGDLLSELLDRYIDDYSLIDNLETAINLVSDENLKEDLNKLYDFIKKYEEERNNNCIINII